MMKDSGFMPEPKRQERVVAALRKVSDETGRSLAQVALAWLRHRTVPVIPIIGARRIPQLEDNMASLSLALTHQQVSTLDEASNVELGFPYDFYRRELPRTVAYGGMRDRILA
jgi:aryl-alcohol dehydrogenase-like predicted oxidoreductase